MGRTWVFSVIIMLLLLGSFFPQTNLEASTEVPVRTWFLHGRSVNGQVNYTMNESSPEVYTTDPDLGGQNSIVGYAHFGSCSNCIGTELEFTLNPAYPNGFELLAGTASVEIWMKASKDQSPCCSALYQFNAQFNFTLTTSGGQIVGSKVTIVVFQMQNYSGSTFLGLNHTSIPIPVPAAISLSPSEAVSLKMTYVNPESQHPITFSFNTTPAHPAAVRVPAYYFTSQVNLESDKSDGRLGDAFHFRGTLSNSWNGSGIAGQTVSLTAHIVGPGIQTFPIGMITTGETGDFSYDWSPRVLGQFWIEASWHGNRFLTAASSNQDPPYITVNKAFSKLTMQLSVPVGYPGFSVAIRGTLTGLAGPLGAADIVIAFNVPGSETWTILTSAQTASNGDYEAAWIPQATGNFSLRASWSGDTTQDVGVATSTLVSFASPAGLIWIGSTTLATDPSFNSDTKTLTFSLSPPIVAGSVVTLYIPKQVSSSEPKAPLKIGGKAVTYSVRDDAIAWVILFNVPEDSSNTVPVVLGPLESSARENIGLVQTLLPFIWLTVAVASVGSVLLLWWSRHRHSQNVTVLSNH